MRKRRFREENKFSQGHRASYEVVKSIASPDMTPEFAFPLKAGWQHEVKIPQGRTKQGEDRAVVYPR